MKITIAYTEESNADAAASVAALKEVLPGAKVKKSEKHPPFKHIYLTTPKETDAKRISSGEVDNPVCPMVK